MGYVVFDKLGGPNDVLSKMRDFVVANGWTVLENLTDDLPVDGTVPADGKRLTIHKGGIYANFRSANGKKIFPSQYNVDNAFGIGLTCSTNYSSSPVSGLWYDQPNATKDKAQNVIGVGIPVKPDANLRLYCNYITEPNDMLIFSLEIESGYFQHLAVGDTTKVGAWSGGTIYSGSRNSVKMFTASKKFDKLLIEKESNHLFGMSKQSSTFLRIDVDSAPLRLPSVLWASGGEDSTNIDSCYTGKILGMGLTNIECVKENWFPKVPHYAYLQSQDSTDIGRNANTLNCISVNLPLALYIQRDPDALRNFSQVGYVPGLYAISLRNVSPSSVYEITYPQSGNLHQVFPHTHRGGIFGYDGISIKQ